MPIRNLTHYEIRSSLGKGGMGEVWKARDTRLGRDVAIKTIPDAFTDDQALMTRFEREAKLLASLNHPNICAIYDIVDHEDQPFIVMELMKGRALRTNLSAGSVDARRGAAAGNSTGGCSGCRTRGRNHPPGHQTGKHFRYGEGSGEASGFWVGEVHLYKVFGGSGGNAFGGV